DLAIETEYAAYVEPTEEWRYGKRQLITFRSGFGQRLVRNYLRQYRLDKRREFVVEFDNAPVPSPELAEVERHLIFLVIALPDPHSPEDP
ncbi:MAG: hypothetical protein ACYTG0_47460, partial [Planctomycetota bacterium]